MAGESLNSGDLEKVRIPEETDQPRQFVTQLLPVDAQVGRHVIQTLQQPNTVAVLTTVMPDIRGGQCIVSVALDEATLDQVQDLLASQARPDQLDSQAVPCVGFHCFLPRRGDAATDSGAKSP